MKVRIFYYGMSDPNLDTRRLWRNYWEYISLSQAFIKRGIEVVETNPDVDLLLYGYDHVYDVTAPKKFAWIDGHPEMALRENWNEYNHVWVRSHIYLPIFQSVTYPKASTLLGAPTVPCSEKSLQDSSPEYDIVFLGSTTPERLEMLNFLIDTNKYKILIGGLIGTSLKGKFDFAGTYIPHEALVEFFNKGKLHPYIHTDLTDTKYGFVSSAVLDVAVSNCLILSEYMPGLRAYFSEIPMFDSLNNLEYLIDTYLNNQEEVSRITKISKKEACKYTFDKAVQVMEEQFAQEGCFS